MLGFDPRVRGLPHKEYRPHQAESIDWLEDRRGVIKIAEAPTGSGKSLLAMAVGGAWNNQQVIALTHTRNLQRQYRSIFPDCFVHWGKQTYPCINDFRVTDDATADMCLYPEAPRHCECYGDCPYYIAKRRSIMERRVALNYAYWLTSSHLYSPNYLVLDEAHMLSDIVLEYVGTSVGEHDLHYWQLPEFPKLIPREIAIYTGEEDSTVNVARWLAEASARLLDIHGKLSYDIEEHPRMARTTRASLMARANHAKRMSAKLEDVATALDANPGSHWFIRCDDSQMYMGKQERTLVIRPITARYDFRRLFNKPEAQMLLMSATIGNVDVYAQELGIEEYDWRAVPNRWAPETRPVYILPVPSMGRRSVMRDDNVWQIQADVIAKAILAQPKHWCGLILVTRKAEVLALSKRLAVRGLADRIYPMVDENLSTIPTDEQLKMWEERKAKVPNSIGVSASMWTGFDGQREKILIIAKCLARDVAVMGPDGLVTYDNVKIGDRVFALDENSNIIVDNIVSIVKKPYSGSMYKFTGKKYDVSVTPDHRMLYKTSNDTRNLQSDTWRTGEASSISDMYISLPTIANGWQGNQLPSTVSFEDFFNDDTLIWIKPIVKPHHAPLPPFIRHRSAKYSTIYSVRWGDIKHTGWTPRPGDHPFFSDRLWGNRVPYYWDTEKFLRLAGWFISEGYASYKTVSGHDGSYYIGISQNAGEILDAMVAHIQSMNLTYNCYSENNDKARDVLVFSNVVYRAFVSWFGKGARNKTVPRFIMDSDTNSLKIIMQSMMEGDGSTDGEYYSTSSDQLRLDFSELCLKLGMAPSYKWYDHVWHVYLGKNSLGTCVPNNNVSIEQYDDMVWCITTNSDTLLATRDGKFVFTRNCPFPSLASDFERARMAFSSTTFQWRTACLLEQGLGRTRRGNREDYEIDGLHQGYVAIADDDWRRTRGYLSQGILDAIVELPKGAYK